MPAVDFNRTIRVGAPAEVAWASVTDVDRVAGWVPVVGNVTELEHLARYAAVLTDRLGPFRLSADLVVDVTELREGSFIRFIADGEDRQVSSRIQIEASLELVDAGAGTDVVVGGRYEVTGRVATLGASMIRAKGDTILDQFFTALAEELS